MKWKQQIYEDSSLTVSGVIPYVYIIVNLNIQKLILGFE